jgi:hypothetical protein
MTDKNYVVNVAVINESTVVSDAQVYACVYALQIQTKHDFYPIWGIASNVYVATRTQKIPAGHYQLIIMDDADQAGALGYHDLTSTGDPLGKVFVKTTMQAGENWTVTTSHELLEMLVDPYINLVVFLQSTNIAGRLIPYEVCDAVQGDKCTYKIASAGNIEVSNFVTPAWFEDFRAANSTVFDFKKVLTQPFQLYSGGYVSYFDITQASGWKQTFLQDQAPSAADHSRARHELRDKPRCDWMLSYSK